MVVVGGMGEGKWGRTKIGSRSKLRAFRLASSSEEVWTGGSFQGTRECVEPPVLLGSFKRLQIFEAGSRG